MHPESPALHHFQEERFERQVDEALSAVKTILDTTRNPRPAANEEHTYSDKFGLAELLTNSGIAALLNVLERLGLDATNLRELQHVATVDKRATSLRFDAEISCEFLQEKVVDVEGKHTSSFIADEKESNQKDGLAAKIFKLLSVEKVATKVTERHWRVGLEYVVFAYSGSDPKSNKVTLQRRSSYVNIVTTGNKKLPLPAKESVDPIETSLTWLLENISPNGTCDFRIDRSVETCRTPRRNEDIFGALCFFDGMRDWSDKVRECLFKHALENRAITGITCSEQRVHLHSITDEGAFVPVLPLFENVEPDEDGARQFHHQPPEPRSPALASIQGSGQSRPLLSLADLNLFLDEERRSLDGQINRIREVFPNPDGHDMVSSAEAIIVMLSLHTQRIANHFADGLDYIENMLKAQLIKAIGKEVQPSDFADYVRFHDQKLLKTDYAPKAFSFAMRRPDHYPDGVLSIEHCCGSTNEPIMSITRKLDGETQPMYFPINAATTVEFKGDRYLHAWVSHCFAGQQDYLLAARARQFSSFLLLVGKISGPDSFEPLDAIILQNKDEVLVPLLLHQLPSPKDFKDAISSLSPEQKRFATAFRQMQLENSVFAVCCIQLKPQLEALLGLPSDALTKEIKLTQDLLSLFIDYQIPSDLLSFDGNQDISAADKVAVVKGHVESVTAVIEEAKDKEHEATQEEGNVALMSKPARGAESLDLSERMLRCALVFRLGTGPPESAKLLAMYDHASQYELHGRLLAGGGERCGGRGQNYAEAVAVVIGNDPPGKALEPGVLGGFKVVQSTMHQVVYGADADGLCLAVITGLQYPARLAIQMLVELYGHYEQFDLRAKSVTTNSLLKNSMPKLKALCHKYDNLSNVDRARSLIAKVDEVKAQMQDNIATMLRNTEQAESLVERSDALNEQASVFKKKSTDLRRQMRMAPVMKLRRMVVAGRPSRPPPSVIRPPAAAVITVGRPKGAPNYAESAPGSFKGNQRAQAKTMHQQQEEKLENLDDAVARVGQMSLEIQEELGQQNKTLHEMDDVSADDDATISDKKPSPEMSSSSTSNGKKKVADFETPEMAKDREKSANTADKPRGTVDFTQIPKVLDSKFEELDTDNALRATAIKTGDVWVKRYQTNLLATMTKSVLRKDDRRNERDKAFDLLDALSQSGSLPVEHAELHVIVAATHNFDLSLMETVIQDNINPIEKMERSTLLVALTIHDRDPAELLRDDTQFFRVKRYHPDLFHRKAELIN